MIIVNQNKDEFLNFDNIMDVNISDCQEEGKEHQGARLCAWHHAHRRRDQRRGGHHRIGVSPGDALRRSSGPHRPAHPRRGI